MASSSSASNPDFLSPIPQAVGENNPIEITPDTSGTANVSGSTVAGLSDLNIHSSPAVITSPLNYKSNLPPSDAEPYESSLLDQSSPVIQSQTSPLTAAQKAALEKATLEQKLAVRKARREARQREREKERQRKQVEAARVQEEAVQKLSEQLKAGRLAICVGSGVTLYSAPSQSQRLSWWGLMNNALDFYEDQAAGLSQHPENQLELAAARKLLRQEKLTESDRDAVTARIQLLLGNRIDLEATWMRAQFMNLYKDYVDQLEILDAIKELQKQGAILFTTNYDDLLEKHCKLDYIDASDPNGLTAWRRGSRRAVFHPHGYWENANNVVLSAKQYWQVKNNPVVQETLQHVLASKTVLFVGCGGGLSDPNFGPLIRWVGEKNVGANLSHYILLRAGERNPVTELPLVHLRCEGFDDIPRFLRDLLPNAARREGTIGELPDDRERRKIHEWLDPVDQNRFLNDITNVQGPNRFDRQVTQSQDVWKLNNPSRVLVSGEAGWGKTMFCGSVIEHTMRECQIPSLTRARDNLAYFFCATYRPYSETPSVRQYPFSSFLRTVISQLTPPEAVFEPLRRLYTACTRYHPARLPTDTELKEVLIQTLQILDKPTTPKNGNPIAPGETYLVIDELDTLGPNLRDQYSRFLRQLGTLSFEHFHLLIASNSLVTVGVPPPPRPRNILQDKGKGKAGASVGDGKGGKGKKGKKGKGKGSSSWLPASSKNQGLSAASWFRITLNWTTTGTAMIEWIRDSFANDPSLAIFGNLRGNLALEIYQRQNPFRWVYWKLEKLGRLGETAADSNDDQLREDIDNILDEEEDDEEDEAEYDDDDDDDEDGDGGAGDPDFDPDDAEGDVLPGGKKRPKSPKNGKKKPKVDQN